MKKLLLLFALTATFSFSYAQGNEIKLSSSEKQAIMDDVVQNLRVFINKFNGSYEPGTTIDHVYQITDTKFEIRGTVNYIGQKCGDVCTDYKMEMIVEGSSVYFKNVCIKTPYCTFGIEYKREWDCKGKANDL